MPNSKHIGSFKYTSIVGEGNQTTKTDKPFIKSLSTNSHKDRSSGNKLNRRVAKQPLLL